MSPFKQFLHLTPLIVFSLYFPALGLIIDWLEMYKDPIFDPERVKNVGAAVFLMSAAIFCFIAFALGLAEEESQ